MNSYLVYRASFYLMLVVASMALVGETNEGQFAKVYTLAVTVGGAAAFFTVDLHRKWALPRPGWPTPWPSVRLGCSTSNTRSTTPR